VTPQLGRQLELFDQHTPDNWDLRRPVDGVLLTHGHFGHIGGLPYFGREVANTEGLPVWCTRSLRNYLRMNRPYRDLIRHGNIELKRLLAGEPFVLNSTCRVLPLEVPHRTDVTDTVAFFITGLRGSLLYLPDVDQLTNEIQALIARADYALIDGTFYRSDELGDRPMHEVPHPVIAESTAELLADERLDPANIWFIHLNHTNPAAAGSSQPYRELTAEGFNVAVDGETWEI
jgi:pyrroloquinoline quinone biosynthesis protein B